MSAGNLFQLLSLSAWTHTVAAAHLNLPTLTNTVTKQKQTILQNYLHLSLFAGENNFSIIQISRTSSAIMIYWLIIIISQWAQNNNELKMNQISLEKCLIRYDAVWVVHIFIKIWVRCVESSLVYFNGAVLFNTGSHIYKNPCYKSLFVKSAAFFIFILEQDCLICTYTNLCSRRDF